MNCTRCQGTGFLNTHQLPDDFAKSIEGADDWHDKVKAWTAAHSCDFVVCDCCGDGRNWHDDPGEHDAKDNGPNGPYAYNGGLPECT